MIDTTLPDLTLTEVAGTDGFVPNPPDADRVLTFSSTLYGGTTAPLELTFLAGTGVGPIFAPNTMDAPPRYFKLSSIFRLDALTRPIGQKVGSGGNKHT